MNFTITIQQHWSTASISYQRYVLTLVVALLAGIATADDGDSLGEVEIAEPLVTDTTVQSPRPSFRLNSGRSGPGNTNDRLATANPLKRPAVRQTVSLPNSHHVFSGVSQSAHIPPTRLTEPVPNQTDFGVRTSVALPTNSVLPPDSVDMRQAPEYWWNTRTSGNLLADRQVILLTLEQSLQQALSSAPELQGLNAELFRRHYEVQRLDAAFDWTPFLESIWNRDSTPVGNLLDGAAQRLRSRTLGTTAGIRRQNRYGGSLEVSQTFGLLNGNSVNLSPNNQGNSRFSIDYEKPLLRGAGESVNTANIRIAQEDQQAAIDELEIGVQDHLLAVAEAFWNLQRQRGRFILALDSWRQATAVVTQMRARADVDVLPSSLKRAELAVTDRLAAAVSLEHDILQAQTLLLRLIYGPAFSQYLRQEVVAVIPEQSSVLQENDEATAIQMAIQNRSEIHRVIRQVRAASIESEVAQNQILPQLNFILTGYTAGLRGDNDVGQSFVDQFQIGEPGVGVGFNFEIPYRNRAALADAEQQRFAVQRLRHQMEAAMADITLDVRQRLTEIERQQHLLQQRIESAGHAAKLMVQLNARRDLLIDGTQVGRLYLDELLTTQARLASAESALLDAVTDLQISRIGMLRATSSLRSIIHAL